MPDNLTDFFAPHANSMFSVYSNAFELSWIVFQAWFILSTLTILWTCYRYHLRVVVNNTTPAAPLGHQLKKRIITVAFFLFITLSFCQAGGNILYLSRYSVRPLLYQKIAENIKTRFPGRQNAEFLTDLDSENDPEAYELQNFQYHLYPIDTKNIRPGSKTLLIVLRESANPAEWIPKDHTIVYQPQPEVIIAVPKHK